jgi:hypothetical protein
MLRSFLNGVLILFLCHPLTAQVQKKQEKQPVPLYIGAGAGMHISGSGYGQFYSLYLSLSKSKHNITIGPCLQKRSNLVRAGRLTYSYILAAQDDEGTFVEGKDYKSSDILQLGIFSYAQYADQLPLSFRLVKLEDQADTTSFDWNTVKMSTIEGGTGVELFVRLGKKLRWRTFFGVSAYYHTSYNDRMYQERNGLLLAAGTSLNFTSFVKAK